MSDDGRESHEQQPVLSGDIFTILHIQEHQTADWVLSARNGNYKLTVKWTPARLEEREGSTLPPKKRSSKSLFERDNRMLRAFLAKKPESTTEIGTPALNIDNDITETDEMGITAQSTETMSATDSPAELDYKKDEAPPPPTASSSPCKRSRLLCRCRGSIDNQQRRKGTPQTQKGGGGEKNTKSHTRPSTKDLLI
ncbi:unnamed protein product [Mytilus coruscus]|uniref:Uncharacterized protein n=1 Tax=Mytilus coruscus TaxID=42192 RepID=A0A6J8DQW4_MYTCO|nr:unnamed protein product [Mytilus coruscus]